MSQPLDEQGEMPVSVRLGTVVPPEDPEDWTRPLTWVAAAGMLGAPLVAAAWFWVASPASATGASAGTFVLAGLVAAGAVLTGLTQRGATRASTATLGAALFSALAVVVIASVAGERPAGAASPPLAHAFAAGLGGLAGAVAAAPLLGLFAGASARLRLALAPGGIAIAVSLLVVPLVL